MMKLVLETHTHTIASSHAYSTVTELAEEAAKKKLLEEVNFPEELIANTSVEKFKELLERRKEHRIRKTGL